MGPSERAPRLWALGTGPEMAADEIRVPLNGAGILFRGLSARISDKTGKHRDNDDAITLCFMARIHCWLRGLNLWCLVRGTLPSARRSCALYVKELDEVFHSEESLDFWPVKGKRRMIVFLSRDFFLGMATVL